MDSLDFSVCVPVVPPFVPVVTVPFSDVNVVWEVVFSDSDCEFVELVLSLSENAE